MCFSRIIGAVFVAVIFPCVLLAQSPDAKSAIDYVVGPQDVLKITCYDQDNLTGKFTVESDGTFTYPFIGRVRAGGLTIRTLEQSIRTRLKDEGYFQNAQITIA